MPVVPTPASADEAHGAVLIPVKAFDQAKVRLSPALEPAARQDLARAMATHVVQAQNELFVGVCCDDDDVAAWAESVGAHPIWCPNTGLNGAVQQGLEEVRQAGYQNVAVAHSDLPLAESFRSLLGWSGVTLVPDRHRSGTNVLTFPTSLDFTFGFGEDSFRRHLAEAVRLRRGLRVVHDANLGWDIDDPADLDNPGSQLLRDILKKATP